MAKTLLLADDSVTIQKVVGISFANEDISITTVDNGDDALVKVKQLRPDVVLADVVMPGKSGYEVCQGIKADPELRHIPVLLLTGTFEAFDEERAARIGAAGHVAKPFEAQTLVDRVKELLDRAPTPEAAARPAAAAPSATESAAPGNDDSFDFFDDDLANENSRDTAIEGAEPESPLEDSLSLESADEAFAFGDDDLVSPSPRETRPDATIAMLPDEEPAAPPTPARPSGDPALTTVDTSMLADRSGQATPSAAQTLPPSARPPAAPAPPEDAFDFEFETGPPEADVPAAPAGPEDFAQATILDPKLGSSFAVSSSDLDSTFSPMPRPGRPAAEPSAPRQAPGARPLPAAPLGEPDEGPLSSDLLGGGPIPEPREADLAPAVDAFEDDMGAEPAQILDEEPTPMAPLPGSAARPTPPPVPTPAPEPPATPRAAAPAAAAQKTDPRLSADALAERIAPALRQGLHETLEKVAWESFGDMSERIVQEVIQRVEAVAWDVVPKLAEALIQEEIRKLKGGAE